MCHFRVQNGITTMALKLRQNPHAVDGDRIRAFEFEEDVKESKREQPSTGALKCSRDVVKSKEESNHVLAMCNDFDQAMIRNRHDVRDNEVNFALGEWV